MDILAPLADFDLDIGLVVYFDSMVILTLFLLVRCLLRCLFVVTTTAEQKNNNTEATMNLPTTLRTAILVFMTLVQVQWAKADDCTSVINDAMTWLKTSEYGYQNNVGFTISGTKAPARFVSYGSGILQLVSAPGRLGPVTFLKGQNIQTTFSDRAWCPELPVGNFCTGYQNFNYKAADTQQLLIYPNGTAKIVLTTWGNAAYSFPLACSNGFLYGTMVEPNGTSFVVVSLNKSKVAIPR
jgi:hypothetical protein